MMVNIHYFFKNTLCGLALSVLVLSAGFANAVTPASTQAEVVTEAANPVTAVAEQTPSQQPALATPGAPVADGAIVATPEAIKQGKRVYASACARCHGVNLVNAGASTFDLRTFPLDQKARFVQSVLKGKGAMPAWEGSVTPEEVEALWAYVGVR
ncbi:MAG: c-type cytochrome [Rhodocyclales bacterium]|nr:c-type cytochrome [Rhodocyclales bacterium]MBH1975356.1 c-type cytochrome [Rhodocyclales bacterium]